MRVFHSWSAMGVLSVNPMLDFVIFWQLKGSLSKASDLFSEFFK